MVDTHPKSESGTGFQLIPIRIQPFLPESQRRQVTPLVDTSGGGLQRLEVTAVSACATRSLLQ